MGKVLTNIIRWAFFILFVGIVSTGKMNIWLAIFGLTVAGALFFGRFFCGYVCPMNTLMIPIGILSRKLKIQRKDVPKWMNSTAGAVIVLVLSLAAVLISKRMLGKNLPILFVLLAVAVIVTIRYPESGFHNGLCPFGLIQSITGRFAMFSKRVKVDKCVGCAKCVQVCPSAAVVVDNDKKKAQINRSLCHQCQNCTTACPTQAISYGKY
ncbi:4Fe-4S binding protein [Alkalibacter mobilis]|uniref:4Fe-4S binding protein n=1 Tax=Alkalibacter mobilis TaxID=2787712 RepID=UPI00189EF0CC|nr:4Fe-4S dicluster domain-containing protein [Alkalibacter mobilis]MBF7096053.1 4Fe-4S binding protein [Alkalibacter mobilis]